MTLRAERGSILPLLLGTVAVAIGLVLLCAAATSIATTRSSLYVAADAAALAASQAFPLDSDASAATIPDARAAAESVLAASPGHASVELVDLAVGDGGTVTLTAATTWSSGIVLFGIALEAPVSVSVDARAVLR